MVQCYELNEPSAVTETIDNEAVVINLERGVYFSIRGSGLVVWTDLIASVPLERVIAAWQGRFPAEAAGIDQAVRTFAESLEAEGLIKRRDYGELNLDVTDLSMDLKAFEAPSFQKYTDMEALLLLDPIHDTDEQGWPHRK